MKSVNIFLTSFAILIFFRPQNLKPKTLDIFEFLDDHPNFLGFNLFFLCLFFPIFFWPVHDPKYFFKGSVIFFLYPSTEKNVNEKGKCPKKSRDEPCMYPVLEIQEKKDERNPYFLLKESVIYEFTLNPRNTLSFLLIHLS